MIREDQGEVGLVLERDEVTGEMCFTHMFMAENHIFTNKELQLAYVQMAMQSMDLDTEEKKLANSRLQTYLHELREDVAKPTVVFQQEETQPNAAPAGSSQDKKAKAKMKGVSTGTKYKKVADKVKPVLGSLDEKFRIVREIKGDPLADLPKLPTNPKDFVPTGRYTEERKRAMDKLHQGPFLWSEERKLLHEFMSIHNTAFAWDDTERGSFKPEYFPPVVIPTVAHVPWVLKNRPVPPGLYDRICALIRDKIDAGVYEPSNSSYRSRWFCVLKKDGESLRIVHSLEPLNKVTIAHSGVPPATEDLAAKFAGRACGGCLDLYVGYDERLLAPESRDLTTFQTPFGAMRLVTLPMGWTNSVPIFHDDVTHILQPEIPDVTWPFLDDVPVGGPRTRYETKDGGYETIPENPGIRRFVWEHFANLNRVVQRMKYCGGTFSGKKSVLCAEEFVVVGHLCTYEGRKPIPERVAVIERWGPCLSVSDVRSFLGTIGTFRIFIKDFAKRAEPIQRLTRRETHFKWEEEQELAMEDLKKAVREAPCLRSLDYDIDTEIKLSVDTSYIAIGWYISQQDAEDSKKWWYARFGSTLLSPREARYSQPKRELFGLMRALDENKYWLIGCRRLVVETDAQYIKGMLNNPEDGPNCTINRWIEQVLMYHFELRHVAGKTFAADGLSRRVKQPGDPVPEPWDHSYEDHDGLRGYSQPNEDDPEPLDFEDFKKDIDTRGGYVQTTIASKGDLELQIFESELERLLFFENQLREADPERMQQLVNVEMLPDPTLKENPDTVQEYDEERRANWAKKLDERLPKIKKWLQGPLTRPEGVEPKDFGKWVRECSHFFEKNNKLYRRQAGFPQIVVAKEHRMYMMRAAHDALGHRGAWATTQFLSKRFWWPDLEGDVAWYCRTCHVCQLRTKMLLKIPPRVTETPSIFQVLHADVMNMTPASNGCKYIVHGRCALTSWAEGKPLREDNGAAIGAWLLEIITRWGCMREIVTDNGGSFTKATAWLEKKYGIKGIKISPYNSKANGRVERPHYDIRDMLFKATGGKISQWFWYFPHILWADRITSRRRFGVSPFFIVTGAEPVVPLDIQEATWLVEPPSGPLTTEELIAQRAKALAKHRDLVEDMRKRVDKEKRERVAKYEKENAAVIKDYRFKRGDLVLLRNTSIEKSLDKKMKPRYLGPLVVVSRNKGGAYILAELDGTVLQSPSAAFRVLPYHARKRIELPPNVHEFIDISSKTLREMRESKDEGDTEDLAFRGMPEYSRMEED